jgi:hypothetical protein
VSEDRWRRYEKFEWSQALEGQLQNENRAIEFCLYMISEYERYWRRRKPWFRGLVGAAFVFGATTPVLIAGDAPDVVSAIPVALATAIAGFLAATGWQDGIARSGFMAEAMKCELIGYRTRVKPYNDDRRLENFVINLRRLRMTEVEGWRVGFLSLRVKPGDQSSQGPPPAHGGADAVEDDDVDDA